MAGGGLGFWWVRTRISSGEAPDFSVVQDADSCGVQDPDFGGLGRGFWLGCGT